MIHGKPDVAMKSFKRTLDIDPDLIGAPINLGNALKSQSDTEGALDSYNRTLAVDPKNSETH